MIFTFSVIFTKICMEARKEIDLYKRAAKWKDKRTSMTTLQSANTENSKQIFPEMNCAATVLQQFPHSCVCERFIIFQRSVCLFCCRIIFGPTLGIYKSLTDTWMWKLGLRPEKECINGIFVAVHGLKPTFATIPTPPISQYPLPLS